MLNAKAKNNAKIKEKKSNLMAYCFVVAKVIFVIQK